jgi:PASTA domain
MLAPAAQANTVVIGSQLTAPGFALVPFGPTATVTNYSLPAPAVVASPVDGTVISWRFIGDGGPLTPRILRSISGTSMTGTGAFGTPRFAQGANVVSGPFTEKLAIKRGEFFGLDGQSGAFLSTAPTAGAVSLYFQPNLGNLGPGTAPTGTNPEEDAIQATVRYCLVPKLKGKSPQQARDLLHAANCKVGTKTKSKKKKTKRKQVIKQSIKAGTSVSDTTRIDFTVSQKKKKTKK